MAIIVLAVTCIFFSVLWGRGRLTQQINAKNCASTETILMDLNHEMYVWKSAVNLLVMSIIKVS